MNQNELLQRAKLGNPRAIAALINRNLKPKGITAKVSCKNDCLRVLLEADELPPQDNLAPFIRNGIMKLEIAEIKTIQVLGRQTGDAVPAWSQTANLIPRNSSQSEPQSRPAPQTSPKNAAIKPTHTNSPKSPQADQDIIRVRKDQRTWALTLQQLEQQIQVGKFLGTDTVWFQPTKRWIKARDHIETRHLFQASTQLEHGQRSTETFMKYEKEFISAVISLAMQTHAAPESLTRLPETLDISQRRGLVIPMNKGFQLLPRARTLVCR